MLRSIFILLAWTLSNTILAQNWQLFPLHQLNHYQVENTNHGIRSFECDSVIDNGGSIGHLFLNYLGPSESCYWQNRKTLLYRNDDEFTIDSLIYTSDSVIYYFNTYGPQFDFVFKHNSKPGDSWDLSSHLSRTGTCVSEGIADILGKTDSVKIFTLQSADGNIDFILSKTHGLVKFIPFTDFFLEIPAKSDVFSYHNLIGIKTDIDSRGFQLPGFNDYFHLAEGDLLLWKNTFYDMTDLTVNYYRDSLITTNITYDSITYQVYRKIFNSYAILIDTRDTSYTYLKDEYEYLLLTPYQWYTNVNEDPYAEIFFIDNARLTFTDLDTSVIKEFSSNACFFMQSEEGCNIICLLDDLETKYRVSTTEGLTYFSEPYGRELKLLGSVIDGVERGSMQIPVGLEHLTKCPVSVYPNPSSGIIYLTNEKLISKIELYNSMGVLIFSGKGNYQVNFSGNSNGFYNLFIYTYSGQIYRQKVILLE